MSLRRTALVLVACSAFAAWFAAAMTPEWPEPTIASAPPSPVDATGAALASEIARLRQRLQPEAAPRPRPRNPFAFEARRPPASSAGALERRPAVTANPPPSPLAVTLVGLAEDPGDNGPTRTAILSDGAQVLLVRQGDTVTAGGRTLRVAAISEDGVELADAASGAVERLSLR